MRLFHAARIFYFICLVKYNGFLDFSYIQTHFRRRFMRPILRGWKIRLGFNNRIFLSHCNVTQKKQ